MKAILLFLLVPLLALSQDMMPGADALLGATRRPVASATCSTFDTTNAWDNFIDGFQIATTGYESNVSYSVWSEVGTTANIYEAADSSALTTYKPSGACSQALKFVFPTDGTETYSYANLGAAIDLDTIQTDIYFALYVETGPDNGEAVQIFSYRGTSVPGAYGVTIDNSGGQLRLSTAGGSGSAYQNISAGQWYTIKLSYDTAVGEDGSALYIFSNGELVSSDAFTRAATIDIQYIFFGGVVSLSANDSGTLWFDLVSVKTN